MAAHAVWALEIVANDQSVDPRARALEQILRNLGIHRPGVTHSRLYLVSGPQSQNLHAAVRDLCLDPILAEAGPVAGVSSGNGWAIEILPHPGVTDAEGDSLADALVRDGFPDVRARAGHRYRIEGELDVSVVATAGRRLAHAVVESVSWRPASCPPDDNWWRGAFMPEAQPDPTVESVPKTLEKLLPFQENLAGDVARVASLRDLRGERSPR